MAKEAFEKQTGKKVVSPLSMKRYIASQQPELELETEEDSDNQEKWSHNSLNLQECRRYSVDNVADKAGGGATADDEQYFFLTGATAVS